MITLTLPGLPPSTNNAFATVGKRRVLTAEARSFKELVGWHLRILKLEAIKGPLSVTLTFSSCRWFTNSGKPRRVDVANLEKLFVDAVFEQLGMEDSNIFSLHLVKAIGPETSTIRIERVA